VEAATTAAAGRSLEGDKAQRIVAAMRSSVARRGVAGSTFDHVAREAGVSRGLLHYYFGTKEALLVEVVRQDCDLRMRLLDEQLSGARSADDVVALLRTAL
jgi:AcrR family transcriptional regulator